MTSMETEKEKKPLDMAMEVAMPHLDDLEFEHSMVRQKSIEEQITAKIQNLHREYTASVQAKAKWIAPNTPVKNPLSEHDLRAAFDRFDVDKNEKIDDSKLKLALNETGLYAETVDELIAEIETKNVGVVDFEEFNVVAGHSWLMKAFQKTLAQSIQSNLRSITSERDTSPSSSSAELEEREPFAMGSLADDDEKEDGLLSRIDELQRKNECLRAKIKSMEGGSAWVSVRRLLALWSFVPIGITADGLVYDITLLPL